MSIVLRLLKPIAFLVINFLLWLFQCNNPLTKEAKLSAAMRILPEWKEYDEEIKKLQKRIVHDDLEESAEFDKPEVISPPADTVKIGR